MQYLEINVNNKDQQIKQSHMGMLMNRFNMLMQLLENIKANRYNRNQFVLFGVIVQDNNDQKLVHHISQNFVRWAEMTGEHFLFITFVPSSEEWRNSKFCHEGYGVDKSNLMTDTSYTKEDEERTLPLLREFMDLPQSGSYLMLTEDLSHNDFHKIPISSCTIEEQLQIITRYCDEEWSGTNHSPKDYRNLLNELSADEINLHSSFLDILIDYTSFVSVPIEKSHPFENWYDIQKKDQIHVVNDVIKRSRSALKNYSGKDINDRIFHLFECIYIAYVKFSSDKTKRIPKNRQYEDHLPYQEFLDEYSCKLLISYNRLTELITSQNLFREALSDEFKLRHQDSRSDYSLNDSWEPDDLDYSGLTVYLGKIVENEMNLSIKQMLRHCMGIEMPTYFNRYCEERGPIKIPKGRNVTININEQFMNSTKEKNIPTGDLIYAYLNMINRASPINPEPNQNRLQAPNGINETIYFLRDFNNKYRNPSVHIDPYSKTTYINANKDFETFLRTHQRPLYIIRQSLLTTRNDT